MKFGKMLWMLKNYRVCTVFKNGGHLKVLIENYKRR